MVTIKDVAEKAAVSVGTASRALHSYGYVSKQSKERVREAAKALGYVVNVNALQLKNKTSKNVGVIVSDIQNPYFINVVHDLQNQLTKFGLNLIFAVSNNNSEDEEKEIRYLIGNKVSTILFIPTSSKNEEVLKLAKNNQINIIQLFISVYDGFNSIVNDDEAGAYLAGQQMLREGYKRIALIDVAYDKRSFDKEVTPNRSHGIRRLQDENPSIQTKVIFAPPIGDFNPQIINELNDFAPDAIIAGTGSFGLNVLKYVRNHSINPKIITFDDNTWFAFHGITTIKQDEQQLIAEMMRLIVKKDQSLVEHVKVDEVLLVRN